MKNIRTIICLLLIIPMSNSCKKNFLDFTPTGKVTDELLDLPANIEGMTIAAYAALGNDDFTVPIGHMWLWGSVRGGDAYKGGGSVGDQGQQDQMEKFNTVTVDMGYFNNLWSALYEGVARANDAIQRMDKLTDAQYPAKKVRRAEMMFLRGHFHFLLKTIFKNIPFIDESVSQNEREKVANNALTDQQLWDKIAADFQAGVDNLPDVQANIGRANKFAAAAYLAKVRLYQAYEQNANHQVTTINQASLNKVVAAADIVINSNKYSLVSDFGNNFLYPLSENNSESVFAIQYSVNDGTPNGRLNMSTSLNYNMSAPYGCCSFHAPSQNMVNAFKTSTTGVPLFDTYNDVAMKDSIDFWTNGVDPRLDHTVGVPTHPFKYQPNMIARRNWQRVPEIYGQYVPMKEIQQPTSPSFKKVGAFFGSAANVAILRYDDVLLLKAEALIELNRHSEALPIINMIRTRAANSTGMLKYANGQFASNYNIQPYVDGANINWTKDNARKALRFERRLEFAMEGSHFFDMVRWGVAATEINSYFLVEKTRIPNLATAKFTAGRDEYLPIPNAQIILTAGLYKQNPNY